MDIVALAEGLIAEANSAQRTKSAAVVAPVAVHPVALRLKEAAERLRNAPDVDDVTLESVAKLAAALQPGTGAQTPGAGAGFGSTEPAPTIPALKTTNLGVTAGSGGAPAAMKVASEIRKIAADLRASDTVTGQEIAVKTAHVLNAARGLHYLREGLRA